MFRYVSACMVVLGLVGLVGCRRAAPSEDKASPEDVLVVCSFGGTYQEAQRKAFFAPFEEATGIRIEEVNYSGEYAKLKGMVEYGKVVWDIVDVEHPVFFRGINDGLFERLDYGIIQVSDLFEDAVHEYGVATIYYSTVLAFSAQDYPERREQPSAWEDFWDTDKFPGPRSLRRHPRYNLEFALLADGVRKTSLYPLDVDRALRKLSSLKPHITVWWKTGQQAPQALSNGEVTLASAWSGRIWFARNKDKLPLTFSWNGGLLEPEWWVIPKGCERKAAASRFIDFASRAKPQANMARYFGVGPVNKQALRLLDDGLLEQLPTHLPNKNQQVLVDGEWWAAHEDEMLERWIRWLLEP